MIRGYQYDSVISKSFCDLPYLIPYLIPYTLPYLTLYRTLPYLTVHKYDKKYSLFTKPLEISYFRAKKFWAEGGLDPEIS